MDHYFYNMVTPDEMATLEYIPTIPEFLDFIKKQYSDTERWQVIVLDK